MGTGRCFYSPSIAIALVGGARRASVVVARAECPEGAGPGLARAGPPEAASFPDVHAGIAGVSPACRPQTWRNHAAEVDPRAELAQYSNGKHWAAFADGLSEHLPKLGGQHQSWSTRHGRSRQQSIAPRAHTQKLPAEVSAYLYLQSPVGCGPALSCVFHGKVKLASSHRQGCRSERRGVTLRCLA
jgi:hypothetical protein